MTTSSASARPYSVFVEVPRFFTGLVALKDSETYVDRGVQPGQLEAFTAGDSRIKTILACVFTSMLLWVFPMALVFVYGLTALMKRDLPQLSWVLGLGAAGLAIVLVSSRYIGLRRKIYEETTDALADRLVPAPRDNKRDDLRRIQKALTVLQGKYGAQYDVQAREAVVAVLDQNLRRPADKHLLIADSAAQDSDSVAIRTRTLAAKAAWTGDVAKAEHLVLTLEDAAAGKIPAAV